LAGKDEYGYQDIFFYAPDVGLWQIKGEMLNPFELMGVGTKFHARKIDDEIKEIMEKGDPVPFGLASFHPKSKNMLVIATGVGRYQDTLSHLGNFLSTYQDSERELRKKLSEMRRKLGMDMAYL